MYVEAKRGPKEVKLASFEGCGRRRSPIQKGTSLKF